MKSLFVRLAVVSCWALVLTLVCDGSVTLTPVLTLTLTLLTHMLTLGAVAESRGVSMSREGNPEDSDHLVGYHVVDGVKQPVQIFRVEGWC